MATIDEVAKIAKVSKGTVSNVFSRKRYVSPDVVERVLSAADKLNFKPNYWARTLTTKETRIIGLNMPAERMKFSQFHLSLLNGALQECYEHGYRLLVNTLSSEYLSKVEFMASDPTDGEIILDPEVNDKRIKERMTNGTSLVVVGRPAGDYINQIPYVDNDNISVAECVIAYLIGKGHRHVLFLNSFRSRTVARDRTWGYELAYRNAGLEMNPELVLDRDDSLTSVEFGYTRMKQMLKAYPEITAVATDTDKMALGVYRAVAEMGLKIPDDLSVIAFSDDSVFSSEFSPPLSGMRLNAERLGREAAGLLIERIRDPSTLVTNKIIPAELVIRESC
ncbi:LacI family transcriptional regulator [Alicyclobacillus fastidiosus]|uniref:LacI family transcriptional regulator n=1 Tax=Alicyclobacillus fastidiosus TaxID=392011 RepID=A0ABY6ZD33_9BACL|nr:LacI family DNA-binding transcriptional regulator [Alicyclobacillus fastidiosus]WAH40031.1 LacI family transcriptional regulator [Alicyclobacillus fastidiosus]GMA61331.1 LacI family transcriptional regulator [Alicyclobacillus fastidiosus]